MWTPDTRTLFLILLLINVVLTLMLFSFWKSQKTYHGFRLWMLSLLVTSCGYFLFILRGYVPDLISVVVADLLIILSVIMRVDSTMRYFRSVKLPAYLYGTLIPAALLLAYYTFTTDSVVFRGIAIGLFLVPCFLAMVFVATRIREPSTRMLRYGFASAPGAMAVLWVSIAVVDVITPGDHSLLGPDPLNPLFFIVTILMTILGTGSFLMLHMARSQTESRSSEERYRNLADNLPDYVVVLDAEFIRYANPAAARLVGTEAETLVGQSIYSFQTPASADVSRTFIHAILDGKSPEPRDGIDIQLRNGTIRHCRVRTVQIEDNGVPAFLSVITDVTERRAAEEALSRANKKLTILSSITRHDIKNQLVALTGYLELSEKNLLHLPVAAEYLKREMLIARTMGDQIDFTRIYEDMGTAAPAWQNISASVRRATATLPMRDVKLEIDRSDLEIYADPLFEKVFYNLIDNALRYGSEKTTTIRISSRKTPEGLVISCEDDGTGIPPDIKARLFERGWGKNTGLGLFLCREILSITGITIAETGEPGKGARFEILVPEASYRAVPGMRE